MGEQIRAEEPVKNTIHNLVQTLVRRRRHLLNGGLSSGLVNRPYGVLSVKKKT